jgi:hypothetical protein
MYKLGKSVDHYQNGNITPRGAGEGSHKVNKDFLHRLGGGVGAVQSNLSVLSRFSTLAKVALAHVSKNIRAHFRPPEVNGNIVKVFMSPEMT